MNKTWAASIVALALTATLAGCSTGPDESKVAAYHTVAHAMPAYKDVTTAGLDKAAKGVCQIFKDDDSKSGWVTATQAATQSGADSAQANVLVQAAVAAYCPEYVKDIPAEVK
jgi:tellurite resistance protein